VVLGDTLTKIANRFGVSIQAIKTANKMTTDVVQLGQKLIIPG
jgi:LysM repeat protein